MSFSSAHTPLASTYRFHSPGGMPVWVPRAGLGSSEWTIFTVLRSTWRCAGGLASAPSHPTKKLFPKLSVSVGFPKPLNGIVTSMPSGRTSTCSWGPLPWARSSTR